MSLLGHVIGDRGFAGDVRADLGGGDSDPWYEVFRGNATASGKHVTVEGALKVAAVWAAVRLLSDSIGSLPLIVYRREGEGRARATGSRAASLLHDDPNPEMTSATLWSIVTTHLNTWGNAYLGKTFKGNTVTALWPIRPDRVRVGRQNGVKIFKLLDEDGREQPKTYTTREIIHLHGLTLDGVKGISPIAVARESIGAALAMDEYSNTFFREGALPRVVLKHDKTLSGPAKRNIRRDWERRYRGSANSNRIAVLEEGMDVHTLSLPAKDLEFVQQRAHSIQEVARWFRVPVTFLDGDKGSSLHYTTAESDGIYFVTHSIRPWLVRIEQGLNRDPDLFPARRVYSEFLVDALMRANTLDRYNAHHLALDPISGWMTAAEVRRIENLPPDSRFDDLRAMDRQLAAAPDPTQEVPA